ncbi:MAG: ADP-ribosylglycohydrolase family protein [Oscillospiraceae bacterium]|nr:ADP-ribosylglycohydrolase family protein [Oscillospiraceae bacterium]
MDYPIKYPKMPDFNRIRGRLSEFSHLKYEYGSDKAEIEKILADAGAALDVALGKLLSLPEDAALAAQEPDALDAIKKLRPAGAAKALWKAFDKGLYADRLAGALLGRMAGCTLGAIVEGWKVDDMKDWAEWIGDPFPPVNYWSSIKRPNDKRYGVSTCYDYTLSGLKNVPVDDDVTYTVLGLLIAEEYGLDFTVEDVGAAWVKYLPYACTAEEVALINLRAGIPAQKAAETDNPFIQWIGADIRSDPWGYLAPGLPEKAAEMAWTDAWVSHRRNGIFGEMYFSAAIAAAFAVNDAVEALRLGLAEIPKDCLLARDVAWALDAGKGIKDYREARAAVDERFGEMSGVHTNNNACLTIFGLMIGGDDFTRCIGETVAMGYDNDCTAATVGSLFGAAYGVGAIPGHWYRPFNNKVLTYINGHPEFAVDDLLARYEALAKKLFD